MKRLLALLVMAAAFVFWGGQLFIANAQTAEADKLTLQQMAENIPLPPKRPVYNRIKASPASPVKNEPRIVRTIRQNDSWAQIGPDGNVVRRGVGQYPDPNTQSSANTAASKPVPAPTPNSLSPMRTTKAEPSVNSPTSPVKKAQEEIRTASVPREKTSNQPQKSAVKKSGTEVKKQYYLFDRRGPEEVRNLAGRYVREGPNGGMMVRDTQDAAREYEVPKARFFVEYYAVPTKEMLDSSDALRMPNSPGYQEK